MNRPRLYIVCGLPFAGKSTLTRELVRQCGYHAIDVDAINTDVDPLWWLFRGLCEPLIRR